MSLFGNLLGKKNKQSLDCESESTDLAEMATDSEVKKVSEAELVDYAKHYDKDLAHKLLKKLRKATRDKPKVVAGTSAAIVTTLGTLLSALDNPETPVERKMCILGAIGYIVLPLDLIPDFVLGMGYGDDLASAAVVVTAVTMYSNFSMEELDREIDVEEAKKLAGKSNKLMLEDISSDIEDGGECCAEEAAFSADETDECVTEDVSDNHGNESNEDNLIDEVSVDDSELVCNISIDDIEDKFYESSVKTPGITRRIFFAPNNEVEVAKAHKSYAKYGAVEKPILLYDATVFGACDNGFLITDKNIYIHNVFSKIQKMPVKKIKKISISSEKSGVASFVINGITINLPYIKDDEKNALYELLQYIVFGK